MKVLIKNTIIILAFAIAQANEPMKNAKSTTTNNSAAKTTFVKGELENGLKYYIFYVPDTEKRTGVRLQVRVGSADERSNEYGSAHMVEHLVFQGGKKFPKGTWDYLQEQGWQRGRQYNASTGYEKTTYIFNPPKGNKAYELLWQVMADMVLEPTLTASAWDKERHIVLAEWRGDRGVSTRLGVQNNNILFRGARRTQSEIIGSEEDIKTRQVDVLQAFHQRWYHPNNMKLLVVSSAMSIDAIEAQIKKTFSAYPRKKIPTRDRDYYEPKLQKGWQIRQIKDKDSSSVKVALTFRFDNSEYDNDSPNADVTNRILDNFAITIINNRLKKIRNQLPKNIDKIYFQNMVLGHHTSGADLIASIAPDAHAEGLKQLLTVREQLLRYPVETVEMQSYRKELEELIKNDKANPDLPITYNAVGKYASDRVFDEIPIRTPGQEAFIMEELLKNITADDITVRIKRWFSADDKVLRMQASTDVALPSAEQLDHQIAALKKATIDKPPINDNKPLNNKLPAIKQTGKIISEKIDSKNHVVEWQLSNGDRFVLLNNNVSKDRAYLQIEAPVGYSANRLNPWLSKMAADVIWQSAPKGFDKYTMPRWQQENDVGLYQFLDERRWTIGGNSKKQALGKLFHRYHAQLNAAQVGEAFRSNRIEKMQAITTDSHKKSKAKQQAHTKLIYGKSRMPDPTLTELKNLKADDLFSQWQVLVHTPVTYYLITDLPVEEVKALVSKYLAGIPRQMQTASFNSDKPLSGQAQNTFITGSEPRADISASTWRQQTPTPKLTAEIAITEQIATKYLKIALRDEMQGVYSLNISSSVDFNNDIWFTHLDFNSKIESADALWKQAEKTLQHLSDKISEQDFLQAKEIFEKKEKNKLTEPHTWLHRLSLSYHYYGDARHLSDMRNILNSIVLNDIKNVSKQMWNSENRRLFKVIPENINKNININ